MKTTSNSGSFNSSKVRIVTPYALTRKLIIKPREEGSTLLKFFTTRFPYIPESEWEKRIHNEWIQCNGIPLKPGAILRNNQILNHYSPRVVEPSVPDEVRVLEETKDWLIVYKPAPMPVHQGGRYYKNTLLNILKEMGYSDAKMVHRLDSVTSGLVLFARNKPAAAKLQSLFAGKGVNKWYYAMVKGEFGPEKCLVDVPVRRKDSFIFECGQHLPGTKNASTEISLIRTSNGNSLVKCIPYTGRTHQIRLHLKFLGFPIIDDPIYGPEGDASGTILQRRSIKLQSSGISIPKLSLHKEITAPREWVKEF